MFESSVNSYGRKTELFREQLKKQFESSVNSYGRKTKNISMQAVKGLRVV